MTDVRLVRKVTGPVDASVEVPGSKSIANRALICAALAAGRSTIEGLPAGDDTAALVECLGPLGIAVTIEAGSAVVNGRGGALLPGPATLPARLAGTTSRFVTALAALGRGPYVIDGDAPLRTRPMGPLHDALVALGASVRPLASPGRLPVEVTGPATGGRVAVSGDVSSQFVTALMLIGPYLPGGLRIDLTSPLVSRPYVEMTSAVMSAFGVGPVRVADESIAVDPGRYAPTTYRVEPDATSAGYPLAVAALAGGTIVVRGMSRPSLQGDMRLMDILASMGCSVVWRGDGVAVSRDPARSLTGVDVDMADISDLVPTLAVVAATASSATRIRGVGFIRGKESDRLGDLAAELAKTGACVTIEVDGLLIEPAPTALHGSRLATHHDHRLAMAFGVLGTVVEDIEVEDPSVVAKSWPDFWQMLEHITGPARAPRVKMVHVSSTPNHAALMARLRRGGVLLQSARGPVPNVAELVAGEPIKGSWWSHPRSHEIFDAINRLRNSPAVVATRLINGKITLVHRRIWPVLVRLADRFPPPALDAIEEEHTPSGAHRTIVTPFPKWVPADALNESAVLGELDALEFLPKVLR